VVAPTAVQRGAVDDPRGGRWRASGTLVEVAGCSDAVAQVFRAEHRFYAAALNAAKAGRAAVDEDDDIIEIDGEAAGPLVASGALPSSDLLKAVCMVYHKFIHAQRLDTFAPAPEAGAGPSKAADPDSDSDVDEAADIMPRSHGKGKGPAGKGGRPARKAAAAVHAQEHAPLLSLHYCLISPELHIVRNCADVQDDLVSRMLAAGSSAPGDVFSVRLAFRCSKQPGVVALAHISVLYFPYTDGAESRPGELAEATDGKMVVRRCGRTLQQVMKPMLLPLPWLGALGWPTDGRDNRDGSFNKAMLAIRHPLQHRTSGFVDLSAAFTPKSDKSELMPTSDWTAALKALSENSPEKVDGALAFAGASVQMAVCGPGGRGLDASAAHSGAYRPFDTAELRRLFLAWVAGRHAALDQEATQSMPDNTKPFVFVMPESFPGGDAVAFSDGHTRKNGDYFAGWRRLNLVGMRPKTMPERAEASAQVRLLVKKAANWAGRLERLKGYCPPAEEGYLFTLRLVVTPGPPGDEASPEKTMVVLDPWTADPHAAERTGIKLTAACLGLEVTASDDELAGSLKAAARLHRASVRPMRNLLQDGGVEWLSEEQFWDKARAIKASLPARIALVPQLWTQAAGAADGSSDGSIRVLPSPPGSTEPPTIEADCDAASLSHLPFALLRDQSSLPPQQHTAGLEGAAQPTSARLHDSSVRLRVSMQHSDGTVVQLDGPGGKLLATLYKDNDAYRGLYYFTVPLPSPGDFVLRLEAVPEEERCSFQCVAVPPLVYRVRVAAPTGLVPASRGTCRGCVHPGTCVGGDNVPLPRGAPCPRWEAAGLTLQLHALSPLSQPLFFSQRASRRAMRPGHPTQPTRWPADLVAPAGGDDQVRRYSVAFAVRDSRTDGECDIQLAGQPRLALSANGLDLRVTDLRLAGGTLPAGSAYRDPASKNRAPGAPIAARLVMTVTDRGEDPDDDAEGDDAVTVSAELNLQIAPGPLHALRPELEAEVAAVADVAATPLRSLRQRFGAQMEVGDATLRASLRDKSGNLTSDGASGRNAVRLTLESAFAPIGANSGLTIENGVASLRLRLPPGSAAYHATLKPPAPTSVVALEIEGAVATRRMRLLPATLFGDGLRAVAPLTGTAGDTLTLPDAAAQVIRGPNAGEVDATFAGTMCFADVTSASSAWNRALRDCDTPMRAGGEGTPLPPLPLPAAAGEHRLVVIVRTAEGLEVARKEVALRIEAGPVAQLKPPPGPARASAPVAAGAPLRLTITAADRCGNPVAPPPELLAALRCTVVNRDPRPAARSLRAALTMTAPPEVGDAPGAVVLSLQVSGAAPQEVSIEVKMPLPPRAPDASDAAAAPDGDENGDPTAPRFAMIMLRQKLMVGPPCATLSQASLVGATVDPQGDVVVRRGDSMPLRLEIRDAAGNAAGATMASAAVIELDAPSRCGVSLPHRAMAVWRDGTGLVEGLAVAPDAPLGPCALAVRVWATLQQPPMELRLRLRIEEGCFASQLLAEAADGSALAADVDGTPLLVVQAGAPLPLRARARTAAGGAPDPVPPPPALLLRFVGGAAQLLRHVSTADAGSDAASGAVYTLGDACAPEAAGDYAAEWLLPGSGGRPAHRAALRLRVTPRLAAPPRPPRLALRYAPADVSLEVAGGADRGGGGVLAASLAVALCDCFGNALRGRDAATLLRSRKVTLCFERSVGGDAEPIWAPAPGDPATLSAALNADEGLAQFGAVVAGAGLDWPDGAYRLVARLEQRAGGSAAAGDVAESDGLEFDFLSAGGGETRLQRQRAGADQVRRRAAAESALRVAEAALAVATRDGATVAAAAAAAATALAAMGAGTPERINAAAGAEAREPELHIRHAYLDAYRRHALSGALPRALGTVAELLRGEGPDVALRLAGLAGSRAAWLLCRTQADVTALEMGPLGGTLVALPLEDNVDLAVGPEEDALHPSGQRPLKLQEPNSAGFVGYFVNLVRLSPDQLAVRLQVTRRSGGAPGGPGRGRGAQQTLTQQLGLRRTALFQLFGKAMLFTTRAAMHAHNSMYGASGGLHCLEDASSVGGAGVRYGAGARANAGQGVRPGIAPFAEWRDSPLRADARAVGAAITAADAERAAVAHITELTAKRNAARDELAAARAAAPRGPVDAAPGHPRPDATAPDAKRARRR
jgi:hypothetical protein